MWDLLDIFGILLGTAWWDSTCATIWPKDDYINVEITEMVPLDRSTISGS